MRAGGRTRRAVLRAGAGALAAALAGCTAGGGSSTPTRSATATSRPTATPSTERAAIGTLTPTPTAGGTSWRSAQLIDVTTGDLFTVQQFSGQPVLLEFFAVWCPVCTSQQKVLREVTAQVDDLVVISLNTDPNEDAERVRSHVNQYDGFDWRYAVAPSAMTRSLIDEFGSVIANPPAAPIVRVCPDGSAKLLERRGVKPADDLVAAVEQC